MTGSRKSIDRRKITEKGKLKSICNLKSSYNQISKKSLRIHIKNPLIRLLIRLFILNINLKSKNPLIMLFSHFINPKSLVVFSFLGLDCQVVQSLHCSGSGI